MVRMKCTNEQCLKEWNYSGKQKVYATCPDCKKSVKIEDGVMDDGEETS